MEPQIQRYYLGCPIWANKHWVGSFYGKEARPKDYLTQYAQVLNTIEGNHTFYGSPKAEAVLRWKQETPAHFRFSFKFPQTITHTHKLLYVEEETSKFFQILEPLHEKIGIFFLQLPPSFNKSGLPTLKKYLTSLPKSFSYAVEVRHHDFYQGETEQKLNALLEEMGVNRAIFDTVALQSIESEDIGIREAQRKKPKMQECLVATSVNPFLRFVGHPSVEPNVERLRYLVTHISKWIQEGRTPYIFMHEPPEDQYAPQLCRRFHQLLAETLPEVGQMPPWAGEQKEQIPKQKTLF